MQPRPGRQTEQIDTSCSDVLPHLPGPNRKADGPQFVVQLGVDQVDLPQVRQVRVPARPRAVLDFLAHVRVALDAQSGQESDAALIRFAQRVPLAATYGGHDCGHQLEPSLSAGLNPTLLRFDLSYPRSSI